eukprot:COSAG03_NODE_483_length_7559_cov_2.993432_9_plen_63_part_01
MLYLLLYLDGVPGLVLHHQQCGIPEDVTRCARALCVCVCVCVCARARARARVCVVCVCARARA